MTAPDASLLAERIESIQRDMAEMKGSMASMATALNKLAIVEERQSTAAQSLERAFGEIAEFLSSRYPNHFPPYTLPGGQTHSVDQRMSWRAELLRVHDRAGIVLIARHSTGNNRIIAAAIASPTQFPHEAELLIQSTGGYASEDLDPRMRAELVAECQRAGMVLGRVEMVRRWVAY